MSVSSPLLQMLTRMAAAVGPRHGAAAEPRGAMPAHAARRAAGVDRPDQIEALFDAVSYQKGAAVLRMLRAYLLRDAAAPPLLRRALLRARARPVRAAGRAAAAPCRPVAVPALPALVLAVSRQACAIFGGDSGLEGRYSCAQSLSLAASCARSTKRMTTKRRRRRQKSGGKTGRGGEARSRSRGRAPRSWARPTATCSCAACARTCAHTSTAPPRRRSSGRRCRRSARRCLAHPDPSPVPGVPRSTEQRASHHAVSHRVTACSEPFRPRFGLGAAQASAENVTGWMERWTYAPGFPVLNATLGADGRSVMVTQARRPTLPGPRPAASKTLRRMPGAAARLSLCAPATPGRSVLCAWRGVPAAASVASTALGSWGAVHARPRQAAQRAGRRAGAVHGRGRAALRRRRGRAAALVGAAGRRARRRRGGRARLARRGRVPAGVPRRRARGAPACLGRPQAAPPRRALRLGPKTQSSRRGAAGGAAGGPDCKPSGRVPRCPARPGERPRSVTRAAGALRPRRGDGPRARAAGGRVGEAERGAAGRVPRRVRARALGAPGRGGGRAGAARRRARARAGRPGGAAGRRVGARGGRRGAHCRLPQPHAVRADALSP